MAPDLFTLPHKALRAWIGATATTLGGLDITNPADQRRALDQLRLLLADLADHGHHENQFIVPVLERHVPDLAQRLHEEHAAIESSIESLGSMVDEFERTPSLERQLDLYRSLRSFEGRNMAHLDVEETVIMPALWHAVTPDELLTVFQAFKAAHPESIELYHRIPSAITPQEHALIHA